MGNKGFSLIEVLIATALVGVAAVGTTQLFVGQNRQMRNLQVKANVEQLRNVIQNAAKDPDSILFTSEKTDPASPATNLNPELYNCIHSTSIDDTNTDCKDKWSPIPAVHMYTRDGREVTGYYTPSGVHCGANVTSATDLCPFHISATFQPICPAGVLTVGGKCARAQTIQIGWKVEQEKDIEKSARVKTVEASFSADPGSSTYPVPISTQNIQAVATKSFNCPDKKFTPDMLDTYSPPGKYSANKYKSLQGQMFPQVVASVDAYGQEQCTIDEGAVEAASLKTEVCKIWVQNAWSGLSSDGTQPIIKTVPTCNIQVKKVFPLAGAAGSAGKTTEDCNIASGNYRYNYNSTVIDKSTVYHLAGGTLQHMDTGTDIVNGGPQGDELTSTIAMYELAPANPQVTCQYKSLIPNSFSLTGATTKTFTTVSNLVTGSLLVELQGGGAGGGGGLFSMDTCHKTVWPGIDVPYPCLHNNGGYGGGAGAHVKNKSLSAVSAGTSCTLSVGNGGNGGGTGCGGGQWGFATTIDCAGATASAGGGAGSSCGGDPQGSGGAGSDFGGGGGGGCNVGSNAGTNWGAGGGGGGGCSAAHSGGHGAAGMAKVAWTELYWPAWSGNPGQP